MHFAQDRYEMLWQDLNIFPIIQDLNNVFQIILFQFRLDFTSATFRYAYFPDHKNNSPGTFFYFLPVLGYRNVTRRVDRKFVKRYDVAPHERYKRFSRACTGHACHGGHARRRCYGGKRGRQAYASRRFGALTDNLVSGRVRARKLEGRPDFGQINVWR